MQQHEDMGCDVRLAGGGASYGPTAGRLMGTFSTARCPHAPLLNPVSPQRGGCRMQPPRSCRRPAHRPGVGGMRWDALVFAPGPFRGGGAHSGGRASSRYGWRRT